MTKEEMAAKLDGVEYPASEINDLDRSETMGLVICYGASDDLLEFRGDIHDEVGAYDGTTQQLSSRGIPELDCDNDDCPHEKAILKDCPHWVKAEWCPESDASWAITASVPAAKFNIMEDGEVFCEAIVFDFADLAEGVMSEMSDEETRAHLLSWVKDWCGCFSWPTDACGYKQHSRFVSHRNKNFTEDMDHRQFVTDYANGLCVDSPPPTD